MIKHLIISLYFAVFNKKYKLFIIKQIDNIGLMVYNLIVLKGEVCLFARRLFFVPKYRVCDLVLDMSPQYDELRDRASLFICDSTTAGYVISLPTEEVAAQAARNCLNLPLAEYQLSGAKFCKILLGVGGFVLHASAVLHRGGVYLFSAPSGVGKSTHARLWTENIEGARIINDDKPGIRITAAGVYAYGTPWCGSGHIHTADKAKVKALYFIRQSTRNHVKRISAKDIPYLLFESTMRPETDAEMDSLFASLDAFVKAIPIFSLDCNMEKEAVFTALTALENV